MTNFAPAGESLTFCALQALPQAGFADCASQHCETSVGAQLDTFVDCPFHVLPPCVHQDIFKRVEIIGRLQLLKSKLRPQIEHPKFDLESALPGRRGSCGGHAVDVPRSETFRTSRCHSRNSCNRERGSAWPDDRGRTTLHHAPRPVSHRARQPGTAAHDVAMECLPVWNEFARLGMAGEYLQTLARQLHGDGKVPSYLYSHWRPNHKRGDEGQILWTWGSIHHYNRHQSQR